MAATRPRLKTMLAYGTTTAEAKTGYGLDLETELRMLEALFRLDQEGPLDLAITFLGAHAIAPEYQGDPEGYTNLLCESTLPAVKKWCQERAGGETVLASGSNGDSGLPFVDVFCETGAFNLVQSRQILERARDLGFPLKIHADEFDNLGGAALAAGLEAVSADHLVATSTVDIAALAKSNTVAVALPCTPFGLGEAYYTPAKEILAAGGLLALATDLNPGTAWCESMQFVLALATRYMGLTPAQSIAAATINAAAAIGRADRIGSIEPGKQADLLVLSAPEYRHLGYRFGTNLVHLVIKKGRIV
jgi:imidazolonepropionase